MEVQFTVQNLALGFPVHLREAESAGFFTEMLLSNVAHLITSCWSVVPTNTRTCFDWNGATSASTKICPVILWVNAFFALPGLLVKQLLLDAEKKDEFRWVVIFLSWIYSIVNNECRKLFTVVDRFQVHVRQHEGYRVLQHASSGFGFGVLLVAGPPPSFAVCWSKRALPK